MLYVLCSHQHDEYNKRILAIYEKELPPDHEYFANLYNNWGVAIMSNNPSQDKEIYEKAIEYMNKAQKVSQAVCSGLSMHVNSTKILSKPLGLGFR